MQWLRRTYDSAGLTQFPVGRHLSAVQALFGGNVDAIQVIKWKELYDYIEEAIDGCEDVGNVLERIVLKNG